MAAREPDELVERFHRLLARRAAAATHPWTEVASAFEELQAAASRLDAENATLAGQVEELRGELSRALSAVQAGAAAASAASAATPPAAAAEITRLQAKLLALQEEVTSHYRAQNESTRERLSLSEANQRLKEENTRLLAEAAKANAGAARAEAEASRLAAALRDREAQISVVTEELLHVRDIVDGRLHECEALRAENAALVARAVSEKERAAVEVNALNDTVETLRRERDRAGEMLRAAEARILALSRALAAAGEGGSSAGVVAASGSQGGGGGGSVYVEHAAGGGMMAASAAPPPAVAVPAPAPAPAPASTPLSWFKSVGKALSSIPAGTPQQQQPQPPTSRPVSMSGSSVMTASALGAAPAPAAPAAAPAPLASSFLGAGTMDHLLAGAGISTLPSSIPSRPAIVVPSAHSTEINALRFHESGEFLATASSDGTVGLWGADTGGARGKLYTSTEGNAVIAVDWYGGVVVGGCADRSVRVWDSTTQRQIRALTGHAGKVNTVIYVPPTPSGGGGGAAGGAGGTGSRGLVFSGGTDRCIKVWDLRDGRAIRTIDAKSIVNGLSLSSDGLLLAAGLQNFSVAAFDIRNGQVCATATGIHSAAVSSVSFTRPDASARLVSAARDGTARVLDGRTLEPLAAFAVPSARLGSSMLGVAATARAADLAAGAPPLVLRHDAFRAPSSTGYMAVHPGARFVAMGAASGHVFTWSLEDGGFETELGDAKAAAKAARARERERLRAGGGGGDGGDGESVDMSASAMFTGSSKFSSALATADPHAGKCVYAVDWSADGHAIASADEDGKLVVWATE